MRLKKSAVIGIGVMMVIITTTILFLQTTTYETVQSDLDVKITMPSFLTVGFSDVPVSVSVTNNFNEPKYVQMFAWFRPDQIPGSFQGDQCPSDALINAHSTKVFYCQFHARSVDLWWLIVRTNAYDNPNHLGNVVGAGSDTKHYIHPFSDYIEIWSLVIPAIGIIVRILSILRWRGKKTTEQLNNQCQIIQDRPHNRSQSPYG